jgi:hypothetical protein
MHGHDFKSCSNVELILTSGWLEKTVLKARQPEKRSRWIWAILRPWPPMILNSRCSFDDKIVDTTQRDRPQEKDSLKGGASLSRTFAGSSGKPGFS